MAKDSNPPNKKGVTSPEDSEDFSWRHNALCAKKIEESPYFLDTWFQDEQDLHSAIATSICFQCPVRKECLKKACEMKESEGIWGGQPPSVRLKKGRVHNYLKLVELPDPYETTDKNSRHHTNNLGQGEDNERE